MTRPLWTLAEIVAVSGGRLDMPAGGGSAVTQKSTAPGTSSVAGATSSAITGVSIDTRSLEPGNLFVPLTDTRDGHDFISAAFEGQAAAALARVDYARQANDGALIRVDDPLRALERIGAAARARLSDRARVIAVTGSAGKTGTKEMLRACLKVCASSPQKVHAPEKSYNNHRGVPLTLARMPADTEYGVFEIGMNHAGEISPLAKLVRPHIAIITNVLPVHVGNFADGEIGVANAKAEIFEGLKSNSAAILPSDSPHFERLRKAAEARGVRVISFGLDDKSDVHLAALSGGQSSGLQHVVADSRRAGRAIGYDLGMLGQHLAINSLAVVAAVEALGCDAVQATKALSLVSSAAGRGAREILHVTGGDVLLLDESYNANPASMRAALDGLAATEHGGRRIAVLGDMLELGPNSARYHEGLKDAADRADLVLCCGPMMRHLYGALASDKKGAWAPTSADLIPHVLTTLRPGDAVMVKGSLGSRMAPIVEAIRKRFSGD